MRNDTVLDVDGYRSLPNGRRRDVEAFVDSAFGEGIRFTQCFRLELTEVGCVGTFYAERDGHFFVECGEVVTITASTPALPPDWRLT